MDLGLVGKVAWVTGGSGGIGSAIAATLAAEGADVAITGRTPSTLTEQATAIIAATGWGRLIHVGGLGARRSGLYSSARTLALVHLSKTLSEELGPHGITSNVVHPGATLGPRLAESLASRSAASGVPQAELEAELASSSAIRRLLGPEDIANVVAFLASPLSCAITGESIGTGGGGGGVTI
jgi:NAD(P)-dependent dehydrogenase (short-subunit alcohol dehydrogenase family)